MESLPIILGIAFILTTCATVLLFHLASGKNLFLLLLVTFMAAGQAWLAIQGFFLDTETVPPRVILLLAPNVALITLAFLSPKGRKLIDGFNLEKYTYLHTIRIAVEFILLWLFIYGLIPESMTFEGRNFDILSGLSAPFIAFFGFRKKQLNNRAMLTWNIICLLLVLQVVTTGVLSVPSAIQQLSFDQPNTAVLYFPFIWLPGIVVPIVIFGHLVAIRRMVVVKRMS